MTTLTLAHGTSIKCLPDILRYGIRPRGDRLPNHPNVPSHPDRVYLSNAYALEYAIQASKGETDLLLLEVEVSLDRLWPDEDFLAQGTQQSGGANILPEPIEDMIERTAAFRDWMQDQPRDYTLELMAQSLEHMGSASHDGPIPLTQIRRMAQVPKEAVPGIILREYDPTVSITNYKFVGDRHRATQRSMFERFPLIAPEKEMA